MAYYNAINLKHMKDSRCFGWYSKMHRILSVPKLFSEFNKTLGLTKRKGQKRVLE